MRVLYVINAFTWAGAEKLVYDLSLRLASQVDFVGVVALYSNNDETEQSMVETLESHGVKTSIIGKSAGKDRLKSIRAIASFSTANKVDIIHAHCSVPMLLAKIAGLITHIPVVCTIHNTKGYSKTREMFTSWMVCQYVSIGEAAENYMTKELDIPLNKITRILNAVDTKAFSASRKSEPGFWGKYGVASSRRVLLNVGRVTAQKNQLCLLKALNQCITQGCTDYCVVILGVFEEDDAVYRELKAYIDEHSLSDSVKFLGLRKDVGSFLGNAECFVMTSSYEGLSVAFLEAVLSGTAVIVTDMPFVRELNRISECATIVPQNDSDALARDLLNQAYRKPSPKTVATFTELFSMDAFASQHMKLYETFVNNAHS